MYVTGSRALEVKKPSGITVMQDLTIGAVARQAGLRASAIRYYESAGVLPTPRRVGGQRRYSADVFVLLAVIRAARELGFSMAELRELFREFPDEISASERWHRLAGRKLAQLDEVISRAERTRSVLHDSLQCRCATFDQCAMLAE